MREIATDKLIGMSKNEAIDYCFLMQRADERKSGKKLMFIDIDPNGLGYCFYYTDPKEAKSNEPLSASCSWKVLFEHESFLWIWIPYSLSLDIDFDNDKVIRAQCGREISWQ